MAQHGRHTSSPGSGSHQPDHDDSTDSGLKKKRIQQACRPCGIKRVKCDGALPCITCKRSGGVCEYGLPKKRGPPKGSTRGGSKVVKRKAEAHAQASDARNDAREAATALPIQSTRDYAAATAASSDTHVSLLRPPPPPFPDAEWGRTAAPSHIANANDVASGSNSSHPYTRYPPQAGTPQVMPYSTAVAPTYGASAVGIRAAGAYPPDAHAETYSRSTRASPDSSYRTDSHRTSGSNHDGSVGSPSYGGLNTSSPGYFPPHSYPSRYDPASASHGPHRQRAEPFYRGSSSGLGLIRPPCGASDRKLPPLDFFGSRPAIRSSPSSPSNYRRHSGASDTYESAFSGRSGTNRSLSKLSAPYARPVPTTSSFTDASRYDERLMHSNLAAVDSQLQSSSGWPTASQPMQPQPDVKLDAAQTDRDATGRSTGVHQSHAGSNQLLVEGTLLQMRRDRDNDRAHASKTDDGASTTLPATGLYSASHASIDDINLEPLLWVEPGDARRQGINRSGVSLHKPEIPPLIQERLFTIFWGIVQTIWPALYKPALRLTGFNVIDPEKSPMLHNAACALAAVAWDSGEFGVAEEDTEATQSDLVERTASDLSFSQGSGQLGNGTSLRRFSAADLGDIFLARAKYYLVKTNNEPSLETIQSLLFMALREGGNGRASQASAYISTACRMCIDLGLHRQRDFSSVLGLHFSHAEEQARRRIFWCLYLLDKTSSASLGRPVTLRYAEIDCPLPNIDETDEHETWAESTNNSSLIKDKARSMLLKTPVAAMTHLRFGVRLGQICEQIIAIYTHVQRSGEEDDGFSPTHRSDGDGDGAVPEWETRLVRLHRKLEAWERDLPYRLRFDIPSHRLPNTLSQHLWFQACKVMLHRSYILKQSSRPDLPPSHRICTDAVGSICDILTAYDNNFGMRKLSSTFTYCIFTASTIEIANTTSTDAAIALEAKRRLRKFMTWLSRMSGSWQSASHHLKILEQLGHGIDADLDGTGLPSHREASAPGSLTESRAESPSAAAAMAATTGAMAKNAGIDVGPCPPSFPKETQDLLIDSGSIPSVVSEQQQHPQQGQQLSSAVNASGMTLPHMVMAGTGDGLTSLSVPGPIGAPMYPMRSRASFQMGPSLQDDLHAQFQAQGQNAGAFYGWPAGASTSTRLEPCHTNTNAASVYDTTSASAPNAAGTAQQSIPGKIASDPTAAVSNHASSTMASGAVNPTAYLKLHDTSYWGAMPLASEDPLSWANFTSSYIEALNGMTQPLSSNVNAPNTAMASAAAYPVATAGGGDGDGRSHDALTATGASTMQP